MLDIDKHRRAAALLRLGNNVQGNGGFTRDSGPNISTMRPLGTPRCQAHIQADGTGWYGFNIRTSFEPNRHDGSLPNLRSICVKAVFKRLVFLFDTFHLPIRRHLSGAPL